MGRWRKKIKAGNTFEIFEYASGRKGLKIPVAPKSNETSEKQKRQNDKNAESKCRWYINQNFRAGDWWIYLTYPAKIRPTIEKAKNDISNFFRGMRTIYKKAGKELKYIMAAGIGKRGAVHFHLVMNYIEAGKIAEIWRAIAGTKETPYPTMNFKPMDTRINHADLAAYIIKNTLESFYDPERRLYADRFCKSRNLKKPKITVKKVKAKRWRKQKPPKGYYLDKRYTYEGYTEDGYPYRHYIFIKIHGEEYET